MICVQTGSRLHFGLLVPADAGDPWCDRHGCPVLTARRFGGVGLMIDTPALIVRVVPAPVWSAEGPLADRALHFAWLLAQSLERDRPGLVLPPARLIIETAPREHVGLGSGTQLGLAVARALTALWGIEPPTEELARRVERGERSGLGIHGFAQGGLLVDAGKRPGVPVAPLVARLDFPATWRIVLAIPACAPGLHGPGEHAAFHHLAQRPQSRDALCRLVLLGILPALLEADLQAFGEALHDFNARVGEWFANVQGGTYSSPAVADVVAFLRRQGVAGVGQSSWGPGVFAIVEADRAEAVAERLRTHGPCPAEVWVSQARNHGAMVENRPARKASEG